MRSSICDSCAAPERLRVRDGAQVAEPVDVVGVHLDVREMVAAIAGAVGVQGRLDRVERLAHGALGQRVEVHLEPLGVQAGHRLPHDLGLDEREAPVLGRPALRVQVRLEDRRP